jgi:broad specificity phosphatase PhoE
MTDDDGTPHQDILLVRHGETEWTITGQHTSRTDIPLTADGRRQAERLRKQLATLQPAVVLTSPRLRSIETCRLAGFGDVAQICDDLAEWDYGDYEGRTTAEIRSEVPSWTLWRDGVPNGESASQVEARADRVIEQLLQTDDTALVFSHGHFLRVLGVRWLQLRPEDGRLLALRPASVSTLGWEREQRVISLWNDVVD